MKSMLGRSSLSMLLVSILLVPWSRAACIVLDESGTPSETATPALRSSGSPAMVGWLRGRAVDERNQAFSEAAADAALGEFAKDVIRAVYNVELARIAHVHEADPVQAYNELLRARRYLEQGVDAPARQQARRALDGFVASYLDDKVACGEIKDAAFQALKRSLHEVL